MEGLILNFLWIALFSASCLAWESQYRDGEDSDSGDGTSWRTDGDPSEEGRSRLLASVSGPRGWRFQKRDLDFPTIDLRKLPFYAFFDRRNKNRGEPVESGEKTKIKSIDTESPAVADCPLQRCLPRLGR